MSLDAGNKAPQDTSVEMEEDAEYQRHLALFVRCLTEKKIEPVKVGKIRLLSVQKYY